MNKRIICCMVAIAALVLTQCADRPIDFGRTIEGRMTDKSYEEAGYYYESYLAEFEEGQTYTVELLSPDGAPIHFDINEFDLDIEAWEHEVEVFEATVGGEIQFAIYLNEDYLGGGKDFAFTISEGVDGPEVGYQSDASRVAGAIASMLMHAAPNAAYSDYTWDDTTVGGYVAGSAVVNGSFTSNHPDYGQSTYTYDDVSVVFTGFQDYGDQPALTGSATITGTTYYDSYYSGSWYASGSLTLSGIWTGSVSFTLTFLQSSSGLWSGTITSGGRSFDVAYND